MTPVFRFAPSPNGLIHLGHALSALTNQNFSRRLGGRMLLRIEDIDTARCTPDFEGAMLRDLAWLGLEWELPVRRQSEHFMDYREALSRLMDNGLVYPAFLSRAAMRDLIVGRESAGERWPRDPDGVPLYPGEADRAMTPARRQALMMSGQPFAWRLDMEKAVAMPGDQLGWREASGEALEDIEHVAGNAAAWGDVIIARRDVPTSYHLSVVVDDALQGVTHVVRGADLRAATAVHRLLQRLLGLPEPVYHHHRLILGPDGRKLSKSHGDSGLAALRDQGLTPDDVRRMIGL